MKRKDKTTIRVPEDRRLDTLAKLLTGDSVCTAVTFNQTNKKFLISTNKLSSVDANILNTYFQDGTVPVGITVNSVTLGKTLKLIADCANNVYNAEKAKELIYPYVYKYVMDKYLTNGSGINTLTDSIRTSVGETYKDLLTSYVSQSAKGVFSGDSHLTLLKLINGKEQIIQHTKWGSAKGTIREFLDSLSKVQKDIKKISEMLYTDKFQDFKEAIHNKSFTLVGPHSTISDINHKNFHAEMNIVSYLLEQSFYGTWYLGISKLTCFDCTNDIIISNNNGKLTILTRGEHNVNYSARRIEPDFPTLVEDLAYYRERFKNLPDGERTKTVEHADFSDSDVDIVGAIDTF